MNGPYDDMLDMPRPDPQYHVRMPRLKRAAQFAPFMALRGYGEMIQECTRQTEEKRTLSEDQQEEINRRLSLLHQLIAQCPTVEVTCFRPDPRKDGGATCTYSAPARKLNPFQKVLVLEGVEPIPFADLYGLEGEIFRGLE